MPRRFAAELPEIFDVVERHRRRRKNFALGTDFAHARQMQQGIQQHGGVPIGEHEAVAIRPSWILRVIAQKLLPQTVGDGSQRHRRSGMTGVRLLYRVHRKRANRVDTQPVEFCTGGDSLVTDSHQCPPRKSACVAVLTKLDEISAKWTQLRRSPQAYIVIEKQNEDEGTNFRFYTGKNLARWRRAVAPTCGLRTAD